MNSILKRSFCQSFCLKADFSHVIIGGGIIGTAIGSELVQNPSNNVLIIEKFTQLGTVTTSRNSEVIHAGLYYPEDSLKSKLCIEGKNLIYDAVKSNTFSNRVAVKRCGKLILAQDDSEIEYLQRLHDMNKNILGIETELLSETYLKKHYPLISGKAALSSPTTGIISVHDYLLYFQTQFENKQGTTVFNTEVEDLKYNNSNFSIICKDDNSQFEITSEVVINSAGLDAAKVSNYLLPKHRHHKPVFAKGTYYSYQPIKNKGKFTDKLLYPCPTPNTASLGTHLTFDMGGQIKFGPDLEYLNINDSLEIDYTPSSANLNAAYESVKKYLPFIQLQDLSPSYSGVRPKVTNINAFGDFIIKQEDGYPGFVNLIGIESPGITASWAIAKYVKALC